MRANSFPLLISCAINTNANPPKTAKNINFDVVAIQEITQTCVKDLKIMLLRKQATL